MRVLSWTSSRLLHFPDLHLFCRPLPEVCQTVPRPTGHEAARTLPRLFSLWQAAHRCGGGSTAATHLHNTVFGWGFFFSFSFFLGFFLIVSFRVERGDLI